MLIKGSQATERVVGPVKIREYKINPKFSASLIEINGSHSKIKCLSEDRIYFIISGKGKFTVEDVEHEVCEEDVLFIPKETPYSISGKMKFFVVFSPEFNPKDNIFP